MNVYSLFKIILWFQFFVSDWKINVVLIQTLDLNIGIKDNVWVNIIQMLVQEIVQCETLNMEKGKLSNLGKWGEKSIMPVDNKFLHSEFSLKS